MKPGSDKAGVFPVLIFWY